MKTYLFEQTQMSTGKVVKSKEFIDINKAISYFNEKLDELGYGNVSGKFVKGFEELNSGGIGYDYRLELTMIETND